MGDTPGGGAQIYPPLGRNAVFVRLFWAHVTSLVGSSVSAVALGLLAHELVGAAVATVVGVTWTIRIAVLVTLAPLAGQMADRLGRRRTLIAADLFRAGVVAAFFFVEAVWQIYLLATLLHLGSAFFTPVYKAAIPGVVGPEHYPRALALGTVAYNVSDIAGAALAGFLVVWIGFRGTFLVDAATYLASAALILGLQLERGAADAGEGGPRPRERARLTFGIEQMLRRRGLLLSLLVALRVSVIGGFVLVATVHFVKEELAPSGAASDALYGWAMAVYGLGSVAGALAYSHAPGRWRPAGVRAAFPAAFAGFLLVAAVPTYPALLLFLLAGGAAQSVYGLLSNRLLAAWSSEGERPHIYAAHFSLSHLGWGLTYPLAGVLTTRLGHGAAALLFAAAFALLTVTLRVRRAGPGSGEGWRGR